MQCNTPYGSKNQATKRNRPNVGKRIRSSSLAVSSKFFALAARNNPKKRHARTNTNANKANCCRAEASTGNIFSKECSSDEDEWIMEVSAHVLYWNACIKYS